ncbi:MAG: porin family protein [Bacteroidota bacterium]
MHHLLRLQITGLVLLTSCFGSFGQFKYKEQHRLERDNKAIYFGMSLGAASSHLHPSKSPEFLKNDSILLVEPGKSTGYSVRLMATARINKRFEFRINPGLILGIDRSFTYNLGKRELYEDSVVTKIIQSNIATFPFQIKFNSDRINNFKVYMMAGVKYDIDLASNSGSRNAENLIKLKKADMGAEIGIGFNFFLRFVTVTPEIRFSNGFSNLHDRDPNLKYSNVLDKLNSRMILFSIHLEE